MYSVIASSGVYGSVPTWILAALALAGVWRFLKAGGSTAIDSLETANRVLEKRVHDLETDGATKDRKIAELSGRTDVALALAPVLKWTIDHEARAQERQGALLGVLNLIAERLGPEPNGHGD